MATDTRSTSRHRRILALAVPATFALIADPLLGAVDTAVAGRLGPIPLGALGLAVTALSVLTWMFNFLVLGTTTAVARAVGRGDLQTAGRRVAHAATLAVVLGLGGGALLFVAAPALIRGLGAVETLVEPAVAYLRMRAIGVPLVLLAYVGHGAFRGVGDTRVPLLVVVVANAINGLLDLVLVFVLGLGLPGIAAATVTAEAVAVLMLGLLIRRAGLPLRGHRLPSREQLRRFVVVSRDLFLRTAGLSAGLLAITAAAARIGEMAAAAHQVLWQTFLLVAFLLDGFAVASQSLIGKALGEGDATEARGATRDLLRWGAGAGAILAALLLAVGPQASRLFVNEPAVHAEIESAWWLLALVIATGSIAFLLDGVAMGAADFAYLRNWTMVSALTGGALAQVGVNLGGGIAWLWACMTWIMVLRSVSLLVRIRGTAWMQTHDP